jgi:general stress protein CsbA
VLNAIGAVGRIFALVLTCAVVGAGIGFSLCEITMRKWDRTAQISFAEGSAYFGAFVAMIVGPIVYVILRPRISFGEFSAVVASTLVIGALAAWPGWEFIVPIAAVSATIGAAIMAYALRKDP